MKTFQVMRLGLCAFACAAIVIAVGATTPIVRANIPPAAPDVAANWITTGNKITNSDFIGTNNNKPLIFKTNKVERMRINTLGNVIIGTTIPCSTSRLYVFTGNSGWLCSSAAVRGESDNDVGMAGFSNTSVGVTGNSNSFIGVFGSSINWYGVHAYSTNSTGMVAQSYSGTYIIEGLDGFTTDNLRFAVERATGNVLADGSFSGPADFAEMMPVSGMKQDYTLGDVLVIGPDGKLILSSKANATNLAGVYSARPGFLGDTEIAAHGIEYVDSPQTQERIAVALIGIVPVKVTDENGPIHPGDLLTTSSTPGHAMKAKSAIVNGIEIYPTGTILGKALDSWTQGDGVIQVLVTLR